MQLLSIGADPEIFVADRSGVTSVIGHLGGSKYDPRMLNGYGLQEDNVLAEFSMPACGVHMGSEAFSKSVQEGITLITQSLQAKGLHTVPGSSHRFSPEQLKSYGPKALEFGCDPDRNAYIGDWNPAPANDSTLRTAGGHVHLGIDNQFSNDDTIARMLAKAMDLYLGVPSVLLDQDVERRELYGKAGAYRNKPYGIEYRTLSNFWIHTPEYRKWVFTQTERACNAANNANLLVSYFGEQAVQDCINESNVNLAEEIINALNIQMPRSYYAQAA